MDASVRAGTSSRVDKSGCLGERSQKERVFERDLKWYDVINACELWGQGMEIIYGRTRFWDNRTRV